MKVRGSKTQRVLFDALYRMRGGAQCRPSGKANARAGRRWARAAGLLREDSGQALVLAALTLSVILGGMAMAVDVGQLHVTQRVLQTAADSAAISAGLELKNCNDTVCNNMKTAAAQALVEDGLVSSNSGVTTTSSCSVPAASSSGITLVVNDSPCLLGSSDPNYGNKYMAEVALVEKQSTFFGAIFGMSTATIVAHAEAGQAYINNPPSGSPCLRANGIAFNSNASFTLNNCAAYDNGNLQTNSTDSAAAQQFKYNGTWSPNNCNSNCSWNLGDSETQPTYVASLPPDPVPSLYPTVPSKPGNTVSVPNMNSNNTYTLGPGYYSGGVNINSNVTVNLTPGIYYFDGSLNVDSNSTLECTSCTGGAGVTLYFDSGSLQANSNSTVQLTASATGNTTGGAIPNMLLWGGPGASSMEVDSNSQSYLQGIVYLPTQQLTLNSNGAINLSGTAPGAFTVLDVGSLMLDSNESLTITGDPALAGNGGVSQQLGAFALAE